VEKASVKRVAGTRRIYSPDSEGFHSQHLSLSNRQGAIRAKLYYRSADPTSQFSSGCFNGAFASHGFRFAFIWKRKFEVFQQTG
jgi:hypothetical protein